MHGLTAIADAIVTEVRAAGGFTVTLVSEKGLPAAFGTDDPEWLRQTAALLAGRGGAYLAVVRRTGREGRRAGRTVAGFLADREGVRPMTGAEIRAASETDRATGGTLPPHHGAVYVDGLEMLPSLAGSVPRD